MHNFVIRSLVGWRFSNAKCKNISGHVQDSDGAITPYSHKWFPNTGMWDICPQVGLDKMDEYGSSIRWGRLTHICVGYLTIIGSDNGLSPGRRKTGIWIKAAILLIRPLGTNISENFVKIHKFSFKIMHCNMSSAKLWPFCLGFHILRIKS